MWLDRSVRWSDSRKQWKGMPRRSDLFTCGYGKMKQDTFEIEVILLSEPAEVMKVISDMREHHKVHPLIVKVEKAADTPEGVRGIYSVAETYQAPATCVNNTTKVIP